MCTVLLPPGVNRIAVNTYIIKLSPFGPKRDKVTGEWRRLHSEELCGLNSSPNVIRLIKSRKMTWAGHVARMRERRDAYRVLVVRSDGKRPIGKLRGRREHLNWIFKQGVVRYGLD
jgi:hypothetical protein